MKRLIILLLLFTVGCSNSETTDYQPLQTESRQINTDWVYGQIEVNKKIIQILTALQDSETRTIDFSKLNK